jgi:hypothetical protein
MRCFPRSCQNLGYTCSFWSHSFLVNVYFCGTRIWKRLLRLTNLDTPRWKNVSLRKVAAGTIIAAIIVITVMMTNALSLFQSSAPLTHNGTIETLNVSVFQDSACTQTLSTLNWGTLRPGTSANRTIYVKNTGNAAATLNMTATSWNPSAAASYITLTWNRQSYVLTQGNSVSALLVLTVSASVNGFTGFSCTTFIAGNA